MARIDNSAADNSATKTPTDLEIMMYLDGELVGSEAERVQKFLSSDDQANTKATSLGQISELLQGTIELDADDAERKLAGLWAGIDKAIHANGTSDLPVKSVAPGKSAMERAEDKATNAVVQEASAGWFGAWQSHLITGSIVAAAVVLLMIAQRPDKEPTQTTVVRQAPPVMMPVVLASQAPEVEELEVYQGSGVVMTIPGDDEVGGESASTVIWISNDTDVVEDPT